MIVKQNQLIGVVAPKGSGKTYLAKQLIASLPRVIVFDPADDDYPGIKVIGNPREAARHASYPGNWKIHYVPMILRHRQGEAIEAPGLEHMCIVCWNVKRCTLVVDEAHLVCSPHTIPELFMTMIRLGRHRAVNILWISQGFAEVARVLTKNTDITIFFRLHEPSDLESIRKRCGIEVAEKVRTLRANDPANGVTPQRLEYFNRSGDYRVVG